MKDFLEHSPNYRIQSLGAVDWKSGIESPSFSSEFSSANSDNSISQKPTIFIPIENDGKMNGFIEIVDFYGSADIVKLHTSETMNELSGFLSEFEELKANYLTFAYLNKTAYGVSSTSFEGYKVRIKENTKSTSYTQEWVCRDWEIEAPDGSVTSGTNCWWELVPVEEETIVIIGDVDPDVVTGGGGTDGTTLTSEELADPCKRLKKIEDFEAWRAKLAELIDSLDSSNEIGFEIKRNSDGSFSYTKHIGVGSSIPSFKPSDWNGFMHSHPSNTGKTVSSVFSPDDVVLLISNFRGIQKSNSFTYSVVTHYGQTHTLVIDDYNAFFVFCREWEERWKGKTLDEALYFFSFSTNNYSWANPNTSSSEAEKSLVEWLQARNTGMSLISSDHNLSTWTKKSINNTTDGITINSKPCTL